MISFKTKAGGLLALLLATWLVAPSQGHADAASAWTKTDYTEVRLVSAVNGTGTQAAIPMGLHFRLKEGWKVYWRSPGDAGFPPQIDWSGSANLASATMSWPVPERFSVLGLETLGYTNEVVFPLDVRPAEAGQPVALRAAVEYLACNKICIPYETTLSLDLPAGPPRPSPFAHLINRFAVTVPGDGARQGLAIERAEAPPGGDAAILTITARATTPFTAPDVFVEGPEELRFAAPRTWLIEDGRRAILEVPVDGAEDLEGGLGGARLTVTLVDGERAAERALTVSAQAGGLGAGAGTALPVILLLAVLGGLILNLMPCVLPVLSIKLLGVIGHGGGERRAVRMNFLASAAGIIFSFLVLAGALIGLKATGASVGWGIQFQQPWFLIAMTIVVTLFACNLWGFFEVRLPGALAQLGSARTGHGLRGHFLSGVFATLLATPCSAPFLGTAISFALSRGPTEILLIFVALGVGLALPYGAVAVFPGLATRLPKPGPWMITLKRVLGFALAATGVWLLSVLATITGTTGAGTVGALMAVAALLIGLKRRVRPAIGRAGWAAAVTLAALAFLVPAAIPGGAATTEAGDSERLQGLWVPFDRDAIRAHVGEGRTVFVNVTADWCITCQVNKTFVLAASPVLERLSETGVVAMEADWTRPDDAIADYLASFRRYGIPFDAVYGPGAPDGIVLPELLSADAVLAALDAASGKTATTTR